jgi:hypothetical protein
METKHAVLQPFFAATSLAVVLLGAVALVVVPIGTARATPPQIEAFSDAGSFEIGPCPSGVTLTETYTEDITAITFFDRTGNAIRLQVHFDYMGVVTNPSNGISVKDPGHGARFIDLVAGTRTLVGLYYSTTVPGGGVLFHDVGRLVRGPDGSLTFEAGPHDVLAAGSDVGFFCAAVGA